MLNVFDQIVNISAGRVTAKISAEDTDLDDTSVGLKCPELFIVKVPVV